MNCWNQTRNETQDPTHGRLGLALVAMSFSLLLLPLIASAEQAIEEIVVTAQKREQALQDVPLSVQALTGDLIDSVSMRDFTDVITLVPGASETFAVTATQKAFQIRGVFSGDGDDTVGYYVNDAAYFLYGNGTAPIGRVFDMERVEVLRGPQGTLYGNGSMGGTVRYITKKPNLNEVELHTRTGVSSVQGGDNGNYIDAAVSLPLIEDTLGLRVTGSRERLGGYTTDALGNEDTGEADITSYRGELLWVASDAVELSLLHSYNEGEQDRGTLLGSLDPALNIYLPGDFGDSDESITSFTISWDLSFATLISSTTLIDTERDAQQSVPIPGLGTLELLSNATGEAINNETRLVSNGDSPLQWIVGTFYSDSEVTSEQDSNLGFIVPFNVQEFNLQIPFVFWRGFLRTAGWQTDSLVLAFDTLKMIATPTARPLLYSLGEKLSTAPIRVLTCLGFPTMRDIILSTLRRGFVVAISITLQFAVLCTEPTAYLAKIQLIQMSFGVTRLVVNLNSRISRCC